LSTTAIQTGMIVRVVSDRGFCFIDVGSTKNIFAHVSGFEAYVKPFDETLINRRCEFTTEENERGPRAVNVKLLD
jgi:cold shock CspA family protein